MRMCVFVHTQTEFMSYVSKSSSSIHMHIHTLACAFFRGDDFLVTIIHTHTYIHMHACTTFSVVMTSSHNYPCIYTHIYTHTHIHVHTHTIIHACIHTYIHIHIYIYTHTHIYIHTHNPCIHTHIHIYTHMHACIHTYRALQGTCCSLHTLHMHACIHTEPMAHVSKVWLALYTHHTHIHIHTYIQSPWLMSPRYGLLPTSAGNKGIGTPNRRPMSAYANIDRPICTPSMLAMDTPAKVQ
jgi:hypothetical protein